MDLRVLSTEERIQSSFLKVLEEKPFRLITNKDIISTAGISLSTFYYYYKDKNDLIEKIEKILIVQFKETLDRNYRIIINNQIKSKNKVEDLSRLLFHDVFNFMILHIIEFKTLLSTYNDQKFRTEIKDIIEQEFKKNLKEIFDDNFVLNSYIKFQINSYICSKLEFLLNWLNFTDTVSINDAEKLLNSTFNFNLKKEGF